MTWDKELTPWPFWSQLNDPPSDGRPDEDKLKSCGMEAVAMCLDYLTGVDLDADHIHDQIVRDLGLPPEQALGPTTPEMLQNWLWKYTKTSTTILKGTDVPDRQSLEGTVNYYLTSGSPIIVLRHFQKPDSPLGHWVTVRAMNKDHYGMADSWTGQPLVETKDVFYKMYWGMVIGIDRTRDTNLNF